MMLALSTLSSFGISLLPSQDNAALLWPSVSKDTHSEAPKDFIHTETLLQAKSKKQLIFMESKTDLLKNAGAA